MSKQIFNTGVFGSIVFETASENSTFTLLLVCIEMGVCGCLE